MPKATACVGINFEIIYLSDSWKSNFSSLFKEIEGTNILKTFPTFSSCWQPDFKKCFLGYAVSAQQKSFFFNGKTIWLEWSISPWFDENENIIGGIIQVDEVTEIVKTNQQLEKLKILIETKSEIAKIGSWEFNAITNKLEWSSMTKIIHEVPHDFKPNIQTAISFYKPGHDQNRITECVEKAIIGGEIYREKFQLITAKNNEIWVLVTGKPLFENKEFIGLIGTFQDITDEVLATQKTKESEQLLKTLIDNLPINIFIKDLDSKKTLVNKCEADFLETAADEILGKDDFEFYDQKTAENSRKQDLLVINTLKPISGVEDINIKKNGVKTTFLTSKIPLFDDNNKIKGIVGFSLDISQIKEKEEELRRVINISSLQNKKLINFAHIISHNLRSHTANFSMLLGFLIKEKNEIERENLLHMLMSASDNLLETLDNLNEVVAINSNTISEKESIPLNTKVKVVLSSLNHLITIRKARIINLIPEDINVKGVSAYIENILLNVISNAIKFAKSDIDHVVELNAKKIDNYTIISVKDNGFGIDIAKNKDKLFGMYKTFHQEPNSRGIGLYIAKNQIEAMHGKFEIESKVGIGTTFKIYLNDNN